MAPLATSLQGVGATQRVIRSVFIHCQQLDELDLSASVVNDVQVSRPVGHWAQDN